MANRKKREKGLGDQVSLFDVTSASETVADVQAEVALPEAMKHIGGFVPSVPRGVPSRLVRYKKLPDVWKRGYDIQRARDAGVEVSKQTSTGTVYLGGTRATYTVTRVVRNRRGVIGHEYTCDCPASVKAGRYACKYIFAEMLANGEVEVDVTGVHQFVGRNAVRRQLVPQFTPTGQPVRSAHRAAIKEMKPMSLDFLLAIVREYTKAYPELTLKGILGRPQTLMVLKAFTLIIKVTFGLSSDAMSFEYKQLIASGRVTVPDAMNNFVEVALRRPPAANTLSRWLNDERMTVVLERMYWISRLPFRMMETTALVDSSKFSQASGTSARGFFYLGDSRPGSRWTVLHVAAGLESKAIMAAVITDSRIHDSRVWRALLLRTRAFSGLVVNVMADAAYGGFKHRYWAKRQGFDCLIPFKKTETAMGRGEPAVLEFVKEQMDLLDRKVVEFLEAYRFRVAVEGIFSMMKRMFGGYCMSHGRMRAADREASMYDLLVGGNGVVEFAESSKPMISSRGVDLSTEADEGDNDVSDEVAIEEALSAHPTSVAWTNEVWCKVIAYNIRVAVHMSFHFGMVPTYSPVGGYFPKPPEPIRDIVMPLSGTDDDDSENEDAS